MPDLSGKIFVITRPKHQSETLFKKIENEGGQALCFPVLDIAEIDDPQPIHQRLSNLMDFDIAVFISANAVLKGVPYLRQHAPFSHLKFAAVGLATRNALEKEGIKTDIFPESNYNSEALLSLESLHNVRNKKILIFRGMGGRELLAETLKSRGADVEYVECYRRLKAESNVEELMSVWDHRHIDAFIVTSTEGLKNLYDIVGQRGRRYLLNDRLIVISRRIAECAEQLQFIKPPLVTSKASDDAILEAINTNFSH